MDAQGLPAKVRIVCTKQNSCVVCCAMLMQTEKMTAVQGDQYPVLGGSKGQDVGVRNGCIRITSIRGGQDIVPDPSKFCHNLQRNILICVETAHSLSGL